MSNSSYFLIIFIIQGLLLLSAMAVTAFFVWRLSFLAWNIAKTPGVQKKDVKSVATWYLAKPFFLLLIAWATISLIALH